MTRAAKMFGVGDTNWLGVSTINCVALDTFLEAMFLGPYTSVHGFVTLMQQELHMILAHYLSVFHALVTFALGYIRHRYTSHNRQAKYRQGEQGKASGLGSRLCVTEYGPDRLHLAPLSISRTIHPSPF